MTEAQVTGITASRPPVGPDEIVLVGTIHPQPGKQDELREVLKTAIADIHTEDGCLVYALHEGDHTFVMVERWASQAALDAHGAWAAQRPWAPSVLALVSRAPDTQIVRAVPAGTDAQGRL